jgi:hypothetical protein
MREHLSPIDKISGRVYIMLKLNRLGSWLANCVLRGRTRFSRLNWRPVPRPHCYQRSKRGDPLVEGRYVGTVEHDVRRAGVFAVAFCREVSFVIYAIDWTYHHVGLGKELGEPLDAGGPRIASIKR